MIDLEKLTKSELYEYLEDMTFRNIIVWRRPELMRIVEGENAVQVIPKSNQRRKLNRDGVLNIVYKRGGKSIVVSPRAMKLLEEET